MGGRKKGWTFGCLGIILLLVLSPVILILLPLILLTLNLWESPFSRLWARHCIRRFCKENEKGLFFIWTRRRDWHPFIMNNVLPVLPPGINAIDERDPERQPHKIEWAIDTVRKMYLPAPFLVRVEQNEVVTFPLHKQLLPLKTCAKRDLVVQEKVSAILRECLA